jgi:hypothetical protein
MVCHIVTLVFFAWGPVVSKLAFSFSVMEPMIFHVHCFQFLMTLLLTMPSAVVLSVCIGVGGWG